MIDFILHIDQHLLEFVSAYGPWVYAILFAIVFTETGLVITPFLPGDSLLFATGAIARHRGARRADGGRRCCCWRRLPATRSTTASAGSSDRASSAPAISRACLHRLLNREHLAQAHAFFERYGGKAVVLGRFVPIVRTFVPFVAGAAQMTYPTFVFYNFTGAVAWVGLCMGAGLLFGNIPIVKQNFSLITIGIVFVSILPMLIEYLIERHRRRHLIRATRPDVVPIQYASPPSTAITRNSGSS